MVEPEPGFQALGEKRESARDQQRLRADRAHAGQHALGARGELEPLVVDALQGSDVQPAKQRDAARQAFAEIDFAAHRACCDRRDLSLDAHHVGDLVDAFDGDQGRIHVHRQQAHPVEALPERDERAIQLRLRAVRGDFARIAGRRESERLIGTARHGVDAVGAASFASAFKVGVAMSGACTTRRVAEAFSAVIASPAPKASCGQGIVASNRGGSENARRGTGVCEGMMIVPSLLLPGAGAAYYM